MTDKAKNIIFIGFKSCGKSTVGKLVSERLGYTFHDLDDTILDEIEIQYGKRWSCGDFYNEFGGDKFREIETASLKKHLDDEGSVLATGGGAPLAEANREILAQLGTVCYIKAQPETIFRRFQTKRMPAYMQDNPTLERLTQIWSERDDVYSAIADLTVESGDQPAEEKADHIVEILNGN